MITANAFRDRWVLEEPNRLHSLPIVVLGLHMGISSRRMRHFFVNPSAESLHLDNDGLFQAGSEGKCLD